MDTEINDDLELAARVVQGDEAAFDEIHARHADLVFAFILHRLGGARADAEEVWQDTFTSAVRALASYRGRSRLGSWLCSIARHKVADFLRARGRRPDAESTLSPEELLRLMDAGPLPDAVARGSGTCAHVVEALAGLPEDCRDAMLARYVDGASVEEVARRLGRSYKAAESLLSRGRAALREALQGKGAEAHE